MPLPPTVRALLDEWLAGLDEVLGDALLGAYARGSLALGDFDARTSDVDVLAVTDRPISAATFEALHALHERLDRSPSEYARRLEVAYIDGAALRRFERGRSHATLGQGEQLRWVEHATNWVIERWTVREHGVTLRGPDPRALIDPVAPEEIAAADRARLADWARWEETPEDDDWQRADLGSMAYCVETMCRLRYAVQHGAVATKPAAVAWALATFEEPWRHDGRAIAGAAHASRHLGPRDRAGGAGARALGGSSV